MFDIQTFINLFVTKRPKSMFLRDIDSQRDKLSEKIREKLCWPLGELGL